MPCGKLSTLRAFSQPPPSPTEKTSQAAGPTHSLQSYQIQQPGWSQYGRGRKKWWWSRSPSIRDPGGGSERSVNTRVSCSRSASPPPSPPSTKAHFKITQPVPPPPLATIPPPSPPSQFNSSITLSPPQLFGYLSRSLFFCQPYMIFFFIIARSRAVCVCLATTA